MNYSIAQMIIASRPPLNDTTFPSHVTDAALYVPMTSARARIMLRGRSLNRRMSTLARESTLERIVEASDHYIIRRQSANLFDVVISTGNFVIHTCAVHGFCMSAPYYIV
jgi:hypothetical protein